ncbi:hypothetical protein C2R22_14990 [Salinigranum rubrum]|uniref:PKD domain-containing protein n=1 Tax=Salinigranum rubrum TaxID=755307 RepID=A0A2I8VLM2_9EURY|nr:PQQ-binding-like beta-propeller repeat protein [Salinigranum rubrum]AUV82784.1 hypothetical protein C2R22_14990 [Salinigranum rubrum]
MRPASRPWVAVLLVCIVVFASTVGITSVAGAPSDTESPTASAAVADATLFLGSFAEFDAGDSTDNVGVDSYSWEFGDGTTGSGAAPKHTYTEPGEYTATVTVSDAAGNADTASVTVTVLESHPGYHGGPANLGNYPNQQGPTTKPEEVWNLSGGTPLVMQPTIVNGTLYVAFHNGGKFYALDPETGAETWNVTPGGLDGSTWTAPAYANGVLFIGSNAHKLHAIDAETGAELWNYSTQTNVRSAPAVVDGMVYFGSNDGNMTALNATTGEFVWRYTEYQPVLVESNPAVVDGVVYFGSDADNVTALDASTGAKLWNFSTVDEVQSDPTVAAGTVYIGSDSTAGETSGEGQVYALNATDGTKRWNHSMAGDVDGGMVYADGVVYAGSRGGDLVALNATDGTRKWNVTGLSFRGAPVLAGDVLYISDFGNDSVHAFDAQTGAELWAYDSPVNTLYPTPLAWNGYLYYGSGSQFHALTNPLVTGFSVSNEGQDLTISVDTAEQLSTLSVSLSGAESGSLTLGDFTETADDGTYTYETTYAGSTDGTYTVTLDSATGTNGGSGGGAVASLTVDTTPPALSSFAVTNPSGRDVGVSFDSDEQLGGLSVSLSGAESATLTLGDFTETDNGGSYTYDATYAGSVDGDYTVTLSSATDAAGNDGATEQSDTVTADAGPPLLSNYTVTNPTGGFVNVSFDANESLSLVNVSISGAETGLLTESDFTETVDGSRYNYSALYTASTSGSYTATLDRAEDGVGNDGASSQSGSVTVDASSPTITGFGVSNPDGQDVNVSFVSDERLDSISVLISGAETGSLATGAFTETDNGDGTYTYNATYAGKSDGQYVAELDWATDASGNDGADGQQASIGIGQAVTASSLEYVSGSQPAMGNLALDATFSGGLLQVQVKNDTASVFDFSTEEDYELAGHGADDTTVLRINLTVSGFVPRALIGSGHDVTWTRTNNGDGTWNVSIEGSPAAVDSFFESDGSTPSTWDGTVRANESQDAAMTFAVDDLAVMSPTNRERLNGSVMTTDAQEFGAPVYNTSGSADQVELLVSAPHFAGDGSVNQGFFEAYLPPALVSDWGVSASELTGNFDGADRETSVVATADGGVRLDFALHYSQGNAAVRVDSTPPTVSGVSVTAPADDELSVTVTTDSRLSTVQASVTGPETVTLTTSDFTEAGSGPYTYTANYTAGASGTYTATLDAAADAAGNDGANGESGSVDLTVATEPSGAGGSGDSTSGGDGDGGPGGGSLDSFAPASTSPDGSDGPVVSVDVDTERPTMDVTGGETGTTADDESTDRERRRIIVTDARANEPIVIELHPEPAERTTSVADERSTDEETTLPQMTNVRVNGLDLTLTRDRDASLTVESRDVAATTRSADGGTAASTTDGFDETDRRFAVETGSRPVGYIEVGHDVPDSEISGVTHRFRVRKSYLERSGVTAESVALYRDETVRWRALDTRVVGETDSHYHFAAESPGLSLFAIGVRTATFEVEDATLVGERVREPSDELLVETTVRNVGGEAGTYTATLTFDGRPLESVEVDLAPGERRTLELDARLPADADGGVVALGPREVAQVSVAPADGSDERTAVPARSADDAGDTDPSTLPAPVSLLIAVLGLVAALLGVAWWRRQRVE